MTYNIILEPNKYALTEAVNKYLEEGWTPLGAPFENFDPTTFNTHKWCQAIIKNESK